MNLQTLTGRDLPPLGWQHVKPLNLAEIASLADDRWVKPRGGLWTSVIRYENGQPTSTSWTDWCLGEDFGTPAAPVTVVIPDPTAVVYRIDDTADLKALEQAYHQPNDLGIGMWPQLSWVRMGADLDAIWLTDAGQWATRFSQPGLYGWDCETVLWLNPKVTVGETFTLPVKD